MIVFDLETSGLDRDRYEVTQFAGAAVDEQWRILEELEIKIQFDVEAASPKALEVSSYDPEAWEREAVLPEVAMGKISEFCKRHAHVRKRSAKGGTYKVAALCGHNASRFDGEFLVAWFRRSGVFLPAAAFETLDTLQLARWVWRLYPNARKPENFKLGTLCSALQIDLINAHDALADVRATAALAARLANGFAQQAAKAA